MFVLDTFADYPIKTCLENYIGLECLQKESIQLGLKIHLNKTSSGISTDIRCGSTEILEDLWLMFYESGTKNQHRHNQAVASQ